MAIRRFPGKTKIWLLVAGVVGLLFTSLILIVEQDDMTREEISFSHAGNVLKGVLVSSNKKSASTPCVVFVHGSGDTPRDAYGYYRPYWKRFADKGWCSLAWDKPGVGASEGDWQLQSMDDRALEVSAAVDFLRGRPETKTAPIGLIGFSQAGWVMPKVVRLRSDIAFVISVSGAVDWMKQARYSGEMRLRAQGFSKQEITAVNRFGDQVDKAIKLAEPYQTYLDLMVHAPEGESATMSASYWKFVQRNWRSNVRQDLRNIDVPVLAIFGSNDAYVDPLTSARVYRQELERSSAPFFDVITFDKADHALMVSDEIRPMPQGLGAWLLVFRIWLSGEAIFPEGYLATLEKWLDRFENAPIKKAFLAGRQ